MVVARTLLVLTTLLPAACGASGRQTKDPGTGGEGSGLPSSAKSQEGNAGANEADTASMNLGQQFAFHAAAVITIIKNNPGDCQATMEKSLAYIDANRGAIAEGWEFIEQLDKSGKEGELKPLDDLVLEYEPDAEKIMDAYKERCPDHLKKISDALEID